MLETRGDFKISPSLLQLGQKKIDFYLIRSWRVRFKFNSLIELLINSSYWQLLSALPEDVEPCFTLQKLFV